MSKIKLTGENSGYVEVSAGDAAGNNTLELPASGSKLIASDDSNNVNNLGIVTATTLDGSLDASNLTGSLPALDASNLTGISAGHFKQGTSGLTTTSNVGVQTATLDNPDLVGAGNSFVGLYIGDGSLFFSSTLNNPNGYYITTSINALNAGPVTLGSTMTLDGTWVIV